MEVEQNSNEELIERGLTATERAVDSIREGDLVRRHTALELRELQVSTHADFQQLRDLMREFDDQIYRERTASLKWMEKKLETARATADQALSSTLMSKDVQLLEKKVHSLKESVIKVNKAYYEYENTVDMKDLMEQVTEMVYRTEKKEKEALAGRKTDEQSLEQAFRAAIEGLYGLKSNNPKVMEEAKKLAAELRVFRDAASNKNFYAMISKGNAAPSTGSSNGTTSSERNFSSGSSASGASSGASTSSSAGTSSFTTLSSSQMSI
ncbi:unnamed protein product [Caenorhabditis sp. 36 PRJEB53466]|nr:unnamed protein product [Caenorhabditis sp. 36 PRJEB53466]